MFDLKSFRKKNNLKQSDIAEILDCKQSYISNVETGLNKPTESMIAKLIAVFGADKVQEFIKDDTDENDTSQNPKKVVSGDSNNFGGTYNTFSKEALDVIKEQSKQIGTFQAQIDQLLQLVISKDELIKNLTEALLKK